MSGLHVENPPAFAPLMHGSTDTRRDPLAAPLGSSNTYLFYAMMYTLLIASAFSVCSGRGEGLTCYT